MDVILTHEQADFDALGAALGAYLMNEKAIPVAPRRMNRNVRAFLTLYGAELPFVEARDLPAQPIQTVTLVDTQSLVTLKGMSQRTSVQVVDHHPIRPELPENWNISIDRTGACTTLFVEGLREHNGVLGSVHATLLLLGIYEDTGSLSYTSTTPRDIRAAAFLLEQGANLQILSRYLNPPLSDEQRQVYDRMLATADRHIINGQNILVAKAHAEDLVDEISTIAHKLRDLLDPDALFLLVHTGEGIRLVARSITEAVDVSKVAEHFGGGGHGRAAAALIRINETTNEQGEIVETPTLEEVHTDLLRILPEHIHPSLTVRQIMSPRPLVLAPETPAERAAQLMRRYGYEGYPVVQDGKVKGLLTRRAVDRALSHKLNLSASSLMDSGEVTVHPQDSIEHLRRVMIDSGWGQIPVVDPDSGKIVGIVTRTDLLKTMAWDRPDPEASPTPGKLGIGTIPNLGSRLDAALPPARLALLKAVAAKSYQQHMAVYVVGGFVRDLLLNRPSPDFDVVVEGDAIALANVLVECYGGRLITHSRFGTAKWTIDEIRPALAQNLAEDGAVLDSQALPESLDLISARTEFYDYPTALPAVERSSIKLDLHRRDFTINTMAVRLDGRHYGELYDYWGGLRDLRRGLVRVLHSLSFVDDPTRMMRAVRFEQRFDFRIEERTLQLIAEARELIRQVSGDRLRHELNLILAEERAARMLSRLEELGLLSSIHPALAWSPDFAPVMEQALRGEIDPRWELPEKIGNLPLRQGLGFLAWLMEFPISDSLSIAQRLRLPNEIQEGLVAAKNLQAELPELVSDRSGPEDARRESRDGPVDTRREAARQEAARQEARSGSGTPPSQITLRLDVVPAIALFAVALFTIEPGDRDDLQARSGRADLHSAVRQLIERYRDTWRRTWPVTNGNDLRKMGIAPGPHYRQILGDLRAAWLDGAVTTPDEERQLLQKLVQNLLE